MKILIVSFSGTGNTHLTAEFIGDALKQSADITYVKLEPIPYDYSHIDFSLYNHILIGYPIHAFNAPKVVCDFAKHLPKVTGQHISIFKGRILFR